MADGDKNVKVHDSRFHATRYDNKSYQPPIRLSISKALRLDLPPLRWQSWTCHGRVFKLQNTGNTVFLTCDCCKNHPSLSGGPLKGNYMFGQVHFHWGENNCSGGEQQQLQLQHVINGQRYSVEMHVVLYREKYINPEDAVTETNGIAVLAYFFQVQDTHNQKLEPIIKSLRKIRNPKSCLSVDENVLKCVIQFSEDYYFYWGIIPGNEANGQQIWIICKQPLGISIKQIAEFRKLKDAQHKHILQNYSKPYSVMGNSVYIVTDSCDSFDHPETQPSDSSGTPERESSGGTQDSIDSKVKYDRFCLSFPKSQPPTMEQVSVVRSKVRDMERRNRTSLRTERKNEREWFTRVERCLCDSKCRKRELRSQVKITPEFFNKWNLRKLFREIHEDAHIVENTPFDVKLLPSLANGRNSVIKINVNNASQSETCESFTSSEVSEKPTNHSESGTRPDFIERNKRAVSSSTRSRTESRTSLMMASSNKKPRNKICRKIENAEHLLIEEDDSKVLKELMISKLDEKSSEELHIPEGKKRSKIYISESKVALNLMKPHSKSEKLHNMDDNDMPSKPRIRHYKSDPDREFTIEDLSTPSDQIGL